MSNINTPWFAVSMGLVGLIAGYAIATNFGSPLLPAPSPTPIAGEDDMLPEPSADPAGVGDDPMKGDPNATVTLIEFTDYQCPFCSRHYEQTLPQILKDYVDTGKVKYVVRDFPLSFHPNAHKAAEASECADEQGKFWEMHDMLFGKQGEWSNLPDASETFKAYAAELSLNASAFASCLDTGATAAEVDADLADGSTAGINGTPGFWVVSDDGRSKQISGAYPYETFKAAFDELL